MKVEQPDEAPNKGPEVGYMHASKKTLQRPPSETEALTQSGADWGHAAPAQMLMAKTWACPSALVWARQASVQVLSPAGQLWAHPKKP